MKTPTLAFAVGLAALACSAQVSEPPPRISVAPSLRPVDPSRPMVVFRQVRGEACGKDAVAGAIRDMKRLSAVDGYLEVVAEETGAGDKRCARVTAYPFRYGTSTDMPGLDATESAQPVVLPGREEPCCEAAAAPASSVAAVASNGTPVDCPAVCRSFAALVESGPVNQGLVRDRCGQKCPSDAAYRQCVSDARTPAAAKACPTQ